MTETRTAQSAPPGGQSVTLEFSFPSRSPKLESAFDPKRTLADLLVVDTEPTERINFGALPRLILIARVSTAFGSITSSRLVTCRSSAPVDFRSTRCHPAGTSGWG